VGSLIYVVKPAPLITLNCDRQSVAYIETLPRHDIIKSGSLSPGRIDRFRIFEVEGAAQNRSSTRPGIDDNELGTNGLLIRRAIVGKSQQIDRMYDEQLPMGRDKFIAGQVDGLPRKLCLPGRELG
jgi:hypothetical protein